MVHVVHAMNWLQVLATPHVYQALGRVPTRELLLHQVNIFLDYVKARKCYTNPTFPDPPYNERERHALHLRALIEHWTPPELSEDIVSTVRKLLYAEGYNPPQGWDRIAPPADPMTDALVWS